MSDRLVKLYFTNLQSMTIVILPGSSAVSDSSFRADFSCFFRRDVSLRALASWMTLSLKQGVHFFRNLEAISAPNTNEKSCKI